MLYALNLYILSKTGEKGVGACVWIHLGGQSSEAENSDPWK